MVVFIDPIALFTHKKSSILFLLDSTIFEEFLKNWKDYSKTFYYGMIAEDVTTLGFETRK